MRLSEKIQDGLKFFVLSILVFCGLALDVILAYVIEPMVYGANITEWITIQYIFHWSIVSILWGIIAYIVIKYAKKKMGFDIFSKDNGQTKIIPIIIMAMAYIAITFIAWDGFKVIKEFNNLGMARFIFQYIYYFFESIFIYIILAFGQKAFEVWCQNDRIPYGGIICALTWGISHTFTQGDLIIGILSAVGGFIFGAVYFYSGKNVRIAFPLIFIMFIL